MKEEIEAFLESYEFLKKQIRSNDPQLFARWKAGGFLVDNDVVSMYPTLVSILETMLESMEAQDLEVEEYDDE